MVYFIASHVFYNPDGKDTYGPAHSFFDFLKRNEQKVYLIKHSLNGKYGSFVENNKKSSKIGKYKNSNILFDAIVQNRINIKFVSQNESGEKKIYIGVDPINSLSGVWLKILRKIDKNIYFTADYADVRFKNKLLNLFYHCMDKLCLKFADESWCVSSRIVQKRINQGVPKAKIKLIPNSPDGLPKIQKKITSHDLIIVANLTSAIDLMPLFKAIDCLKKDYPRIKLNVVGSGPVAEKLEHKIVEMGLTENIKFLGLKPHNEALDLISKSYLGFALYTKENDWNTYGDSMKAREYVACGVPVIINDVPSTADDIAKYQAGIVLHKITDKAIKNFVLKCYNNPGYYQNLRNNALKMAGDNNKERILKSLFGIK